MADKPVKLTAPLVRVVMADGSSWEVQTTNRDLVAWDRTRTRQRPIWPKMEEAPFLWLTFLAWSASAREGLTSLKEPDFEAQCLDASAQSDDEDEDVDDEGPGSPTQPGPGPG